MQISTKWLQSESATREPDSLVDGPAWSEVSRGRSRAPENMDWLDKNGVWRRRLGLTPGFERSQPASTLRSDARLANHLMTATDDESSTRDRRGGFRALGKPSRWAHGGRRRDAMARYVVTFRVQESRRFAGAFPQILKHIPMSSWWTTQLLRGSSEGALTSKSARSSSRELVTAARQRTGGSHQVRLCSAHAIRSATARRVCVSKGSRTG